MIRTITPADMAAMERRFMQEGKYPGLLLMEHAALALLEALREIAPEGGRVLFLCGGGNNGGDGLALARLWRQRGGEAVVWLTAPMDRYEGDAAVNARALAAWDIHTRVIRKKPEPLPLQPGELNWAPPAEGIPGIPPDTAAIVDALFGTGLSRPVEGVPAALIDLANESGLPILSVDIPSGIDGATGRPLGAAIRASHTVTFHRPKPGHYLFPGREHTGRLDIADIGIPPRWDGAPGFSIAEPSDLSTFFPRRPIDAHKGECGHLLVIAGSRGMAGAAALCALAAGYAGVGLTTIACPEGILPILQTLVPGAMAAPLPESGGCLAPEAAAAIEALLPGKDCLALGPGLGRLPGVAAALAPALRSPLPKVIDADALYALGPRPGTPPRNALFTPHPGEMARLAGGESRAIAEDPVAAARGMVSGADYPAAFTADPVLLLKGATTVIARPDDTALNITGTPGMAVGGSGDVLTGILGALLAQGLGRFEAAQAGALLHGMAGRRAAASRSIPGMTARDLAEAIPLVLREAERHL